MTAPYDDMMALAVQELTNAVVAQTAVMKQAMESLTRATDKSAGQSALIAEALISIKNKNDSIASAIGNIASSVKIQAHAVTQQTTVQASAAADQMIYNAKQIAIADQGRADAGLPAVPSPDPVKIIKTNIENSVTMTTNTTFIDAVKINAGKLLDTVEEWITESSVYTGAKAWIKEQINAIGELLTLPDVPKPEDAAALAKINIVKANTAPSDVYPIV